MSEYEFWKRMEEIGQISYDWLYPTIALPLFLTCASLLILNVIAARKFRSAMNRYFYLFFTLIPALLVFPTAYVCLSLRGSLERIGYELPENKLDFDVGDAVRIGEYLNSLGLLTVTGLSFTIPLLLSGLYNTNVPVVSAGVRKVTTTMTKMATQVFGGTSIQGGQGSGQYGRLDVKSGKRVGIQFSITAGESIIGKDKTEVRFHLEDGIVSRRHARIVIDNDTPYIVDLGSANGTFIMRGGTAFPVTTTPQPLQNGDLIHLGNPNISESIQLEYVV